ncbi:MAG: sigma-54 dependent transcriptional regulator [bacterium]|nr:sigma-54 dependent transcriptional regulator [bacterium]
MVDKPRILTIDDDLSLLRFLKQALSEFGVEALGTQSGREGIALYGEENVDLVLVDYMMPEMNGIEVLQQLKEKDPNAVVLLMTGNASIESAVEAMKLGAVDYLTKPLDVDHLEIVIQKTLRHQRQAEKLRLLEDQVIRQGSFEGLVGVSAEMHRVYKLIDRVAESEATVLIQGETGTGKELVAKALHRRSGRVGGRFVPINCGALAESILESELFGHEKGAFTGAIRTKKGLIEQADGGTLFLDEIEDMSPGLQVKLLRAIQEREVLPVGSDQTIRVDFRLVAASNKNLRSLMDGGTFRSDLFYRLSVANLQLPPLKSRREDIPLLANHFLALYGKTGKQQISEIASEAMMLLQAYAWPGNVRELENVVQQAVLLTDGPAIVPGDLPPQLVAVEADGASVAWYDMPLKDAQDKLERLYLEEMLKRAGGRVAEAAKLAGVNRRSFYSKMSRYDITRLEHR